MGNAIASLFASKKALVTIMLIIAASVLAGMSKMSTEQWIEFIKWVSGVWMVAQGAEDALVKSAAVKMGATPPNTTTTPTGTAND